MPQISEQELFRPISSPYSEFKLHYMPGDNNDTTIHHTALDKAPLSILVVDDEESCRSLLKDYFQITGYLFKGASDAAEALKILSQYKIDLVVSDIRMKGENGIELMQKAHKDYPDMPFIIMTGYTPQYSYEDIINAGATDFIAKPFPLGELKAKVLRIQKEKKTQSQLHQSLTRVKNLFKDTTGALAATLEKRDPYTAGHQRQVKDLACAIGREMGLEKGRVEAMCIAALVHDIGKINVPASILSKPGLLKDYEMGLIRVHSQVGYDIMNNIEFPWPVAEMILQHHERLNGTGYPQGLAGQEILVEARIIGVADVVEAMTANRPYRPARGLSTALEEISKNKGILYDREIVDACIKLFNERNFKFG